MPGVDTRTMMRPRAGEARIPSLLLPVSAEAGADNLPTVLPGVGVGTGSSRRRGPGAAAGTLPGLRRAAAGAGDNGAKGEKSQIIHYGHGDGVARSCTQQLGHVFCVTKPYGWTYIHTSKHVQQLKYIHIYITQLLIVTTCS